MLEVTNVKIIMPPGKRGRLLAYAELTIDHALRLTNLRLIHGDHRDFVVFPQRAKSVECVHCGNRGNMGAKFCEKCGKPLPPCDVPSDCRFVDVVYPISPLAREKIETEIMRAYRQRLNPLGTSNVAPKEPPTDGV